MRISSVHLRQYKRFTDLRISSIPESARLVVLIGPNGSGKSSLFDAFLLKSRSRQNFSLDDAKRDYYQKRGFEDGPLHSTHDVLRSVTVEFHSTQPSNDEWATTFNIRSAYRSESDFQMQRLERISPASETPRFERIIDLDRAVSENYSRMAWKRIRDVDHDAPGQTTFDQYREESLGELKRAMRSLFTDPGLELEGVGSIDGSGTFLFTKGRSNGFRYSNLSGGEKAAFDLLLDIFVKRHEYQDAVYCIDEPEAHIAAALQGPLLRAVLDLLPRESQLWIATHSIGFVREASDRMREKDDVVFLDFGAHDFDQPVEIIPRTPDRAFWRETYRVALDDLSDLIAPELVVLCEGSKKRAADAFDARCYSQIFSDSHPEALFVSAGGSNEVEHSENLTTMLNAVSRGTKVLRLIDRDDMTDGDRAEKGAAGVRVLRRREIENYLYDPQVLRTFFIENNKEEFAEKILSRFGAELANDDLKPVIPKLFEAIRAESGIVRLGNSYLEFASRHLAPALARTKDVRQELCEDVFP